MGDEQKGKSDMPFEVFSALGFEFFDRKRKEETSIVTIITTPWNRTESCTKVVIVGQK